jgi:hypothetical protein
MMLLFVFVLNFAISWLNAWGCGKSWNETKHIGGIAHAMNWAGAVMSASGFTWCYMVIGALIGQVVPVEQDDGTSAPLFSQEMVGWFCDLGYVVIIVPILGSGIMITMHSVVVAWKKRTFGNIAGAGYNVFAQVYNISSAVRHMPEAVGGVGKLFESVKDDKKGGITVVVAVIVACLAGILTTYTIIQRTAARVREDARNNKRSLDWSSFENGTYKKA